MIPLDKLIKIPYCVYRTYLKMAKQAKTNRSRTLGLFILFLIVAAIPLTVIISQQQQETRQRAAGIIATPAPGSRPPPCYIPQIIIDKIRSSTNNQNLNTQWRRLFGYGDVDLDGSVTARDAELVLKFVVNSYKLTPLQIEAADVNGTPNVLSGKSDVDSVDALKILRYTTGRFEKTFPVCGNWQVTPTCRPRPPCLDATPKCLIAETADMCPRPTPTCRPRPACLDATPRCLIAETSDMCPRTK